MNPINIGELAEEVLYEPEKARALTYLPRMESIRGAIEYECREAIEMLRSAGLPTPERRT